MIVPQFSITGLQHKHFSDGVDIDVTYTRNGTHITHINSVRYNYNLEDMEIDYNCSYTDFIHSHPKVRISKNMIDVEPRVRQMMDELESELEHRSARDEQDRLEAIESELGFTIPRPNRIGVADAINLDGTIEVIRSDGQELPPIPINQLANDGRTPAYLTVQTDDNHNTSTNITIYDDNDNIITAADFNTAPVTTFKISPEKSTEEPAPIRKPTRWELLELD